MLIGANGNQPQSAYADNAVETRAASASTAASAATAAAVPSTQSVNVTISAAALRLIEENNQLSQIASDASAMPPPVSADSRKAKKRQPSASPMLDVDAFRLIRDKLRAENLEIKAPDPQIKKNKDDKDQTTAVSL